MIERCKEEDFGEVEETKIKEQGVELKLSTSRRVVR